MTQKRKLLSSKHQLLRTKAVSKARFPHSWRLSEVLLIGLDVFTHNYICEPPDPLFSISCRAGTRTDVHVCASCKTFDWWSRREITWIWGEENWKGLNAFIVQPPELGMVLKRKWTNGERGTGNQESGIGNKGVENREWGMGNDVKPAACGRD